MNELDTITDPSDVTGFLTTMRKRFEQARADEKEIRDEGRIDQLYLAGKGQWSDAAAAQRTSEKRPMKTFNLLPTFVQSITNEFRQNKPQPKVNPISSGANPETAKILNGCIRHVQYRSMADVAYSGAGKDAVGHSFGFFRLITEESEDPTSFEQELTIKAVPDSFTVYGVMKPHALGQRVPWAFIVERITREEHKRLYPEAEASLRDFQFDEYADSSWCGYDDVQIAEYWYEEAKQRRYLLLEDGRKGYADELGKHGGVVVRERDVTERSIKQCFTNGVEILSETEWIGSTIPIFGVYGEVAIVEGKIQIFSLIRFLRAPQESFNFIWTGILEKLALANRVPYIGYTGQFKDPKWKDSNVRNYTHLEVEPVLVDGRLAPLPQRQQLEEQIVALCNAAMQLHDLMKATVGIFDASLGQAGNEVSGTAINARNRQSNVTNLHFSDNLTRTQWEACLVYLDLIPKVYNETGRIARIIGDDESHSVVTLNQPYTDENGKPQHYDISKGKYDVVVTTSPGYQAEQQETSTQLSELIRAEPALINIIGDVWARSQGAPWSEEVAERFKKMLPPALQEDKGGQEDPAALQQKVAQSGQMIQQLTDQVHQLAQEIESKKFELDSRERIAADQELTKRTLGIAALDQKDGLALLVQEIQHMRAERDQQNATAMQDAAQQHQSGMQAADQQHQAEQQAGAQQHAADSQQATQQHAVDMQGAEHAQQTAQTEAQPEQGE